MPAKDLGTKFTCFKCGTKFYDLKKPEVICPKCGTDQKTVPVTKPTSRKHREKEPVAPVEPAEEEAGEDEAEAAEEAGEDEDEDLGDDEDDDA